MNGSGPERERPRPLEARPIQAVAAIIVDPRDQIYTVVETNTRREYGKETGMRTIPMETLDPGEIPDQTLSRLFVEEVDEELTIVRREPFGLYGLNIAAARLFLVHVERNGGLTNGNNHHSNGYEVRDPMWMKPEDLLQERVRMGVHEMIEDYLLGRRSAGRECKPVPLLVSSNGYKG